MRVNRLPIFAAAVAAILAASCADKSSEQSSPTQASEAASAATDTPAAPAAADNAAPAPDPLPDNMSTVADGASVVVEDTWIRQPPEAAPVAGGYMVLRNSGAQDDRLIAVRSEVARNVEIHEMVMEGDMMKMREMADGLAVPAGETVMLKPGGFHLMLMEPEAGLVAGKRIPLTLVFERGGEQVVEFDVREVSADAQEGGEHGHD